MIRTGFYTSKGELIKSILYPKPTGFQFYKDSIKFVIFLAFIAILGMSYCVYLYIERHVSCLIIIFIIEIIYDKYFIMCSRQKKNKKDNVLW